MQGNIILKVSRGFFFFTSSLSGAAAPLVFDFSSIIYNIITLLNASLSSSVIVSHLPHRSQFAAVTRHDGALIGEIEQEFTVLRRKCVAPCIFDYGFYVQDHKAFMIKVLCNEFVD
jgi:hypothetical protein